MAEVVTTEGTSSEPSADRAKDTGTAVNLMAQGKRNMICGEIPVAVNQFQDACQLLSKHYGEMAKECAEAYYCYGQALLDLARMETGVLGNALEGVDVEDEETGEEKESESEQFESANKLPETDKSSEDKSQSDNQKQNENDQEKKADGEKKTDDEEEEDEEEEEMEEEEGADGEGKTDEEDPEDVSNLQLAWEMLELAKMIYLKDNSKESQLRAAQSHLKLGEVSLETEQYEQAISDLKDCLGIQEKHLEAEDRQLAESHYQLGLAYSFIKQYDESIDHYRAAIKTIESKIVKLEESIENPAEVKKTDGEFEDPITRVKQEIKDLQEILPDIRSKVEDTEEEKKSLKQLKHITKEALGGQILEGETTDFGGTSSSTQPEKKVSDISHLIRKKRKPEEDPEPDVVNKKSRQEIGEGGDAKKVENGVDHTEETKDKASAATTAEAMTS